MTNAYGVHDFAGILAHVHGGLKGHVVQSTRPCAYRTLSGTLGLSGQ